MMAKVPTEAVIDTSPSVRPLSAAALADHWFSRGKYEDLSLAEAVTLPIPRLAIISSLAVI